MDSDKKIDKTIVYYVLGGAAVGAVAGYIVKKVGFKNVLNVLKKNKFNQTNGSPHLQSLLLLQFQ